ncbi:MULTISPECIES: hypothetical protein [Actinosynnema]|uniref:TolB family protein n=1 Tax=Actinosynnema TaxID=40566 RepID=UPI0020A44C72|nr:hypothetical protein [Actinosynnema pretiosum]MCP2095722.1 hypothetical protein [Actinosynnema pretiosum]
MDVGWRRVLLAVAAILLVVGAGAAYVVGVVKDSSPQVQTGSAEPDLMFVELADGRSRVQETSLADPSGRNDTDLQCQRVYRSAGTTVCLRLAGPNVYAAEISREGKVLATVPLPGVPSRAKVSKSGNVVSWTSFVTGDSYLVPGGFSTRTGYYDVRTGKTADSLEHFTAEVEGAPLSAQDVNYWGLTVADDDNTFYATLASGGYTWLVKGDLAAERVVSQRRDAECPSISPDGTKVAYKKRIGRLGPWDLAVLDLATGKELRLPGTAGVDDQATWLDGDRVAFAAVPKDAKLAAIHVVPVDGSKDAEILVHDATSPSPI